MVSRSPLERVWRKALRRQRSGLDADLVDGAVAEQRRGAARSASSRSGPVSASFYR